MLNETLFRWCAPAWGKAGALGLAFFQFTPCLSLILLSHFVSSYALFVIARLLRGQKEREREGEKLTMIKTPLRAPKKKVISTRRYSRPFCREFFRIQRILCRSFFSVMFGMVSRFPALLSGSRSKTDPNKFYFPFLPH